MRIDISHWSPRRLQQTTILLVCVLVLAVVVAFIAKGWRWALIGAVVAGVGVLRPMRKAVVHWWEVNHPDTGAPP